MHIYASLILLILVAAIVVVSLLVRRHRLQTKGVTLHANALLHRDAQALYLRLRMALPQYLIFANTSLAVFIQAQGGKGSGASLRQAELASHTTDFLICSSDFRIVAAIDLDNTAKNRVASSHSTRLLREASIPVLHWTASNLPTIRDIQEAVAELETVHLLMVSLHRNSGHSSKANFDNNTSSRHERRS